jgi:hypothetical protein
MPSLLRLRQAFEGRALEVVAIGLGDPAPRIEQFLATTPRSRGCCAIADDLLAPRAWKARVLPVTYALRSAGPPALQPRRRPRVGAQPEIRATLAALLPP